MYTLSEENRPQIDVPKKKKKKWGGVKTLSVKTQMKVTPQTNKQGI
jgi:hypothetical protein